MLLVRIAGKALYRLFTEARWVLNTTIEAVLHPLSASYVDPKTGKVISRRPAFGKRAKNNESISQHEREHRAGKRT